FLQEEAIGAAELDQPPRRTVTPDHVDRVGKLAAQHRLAAEIVAIAVSVLAGKIVFGVVGGGIEMCGLAAPEAARLAAKNVAAILGVEEALRRRAATGGAVKRFGSLDHRGIFILLASR